MKTKTESEKTIWTFAIASFLNDLGSDIIYPIWPLFVTSVLNANMAVLGFIDGLGEAIASVSQAASGYFSDKIRKRKIFVWVGYLLGAISRSGYAFSVVWQHLIPFRILDRAGKIRSAPRDAIIADISTKHNRGRNFGLLRTMDNLGAVGGILICIFFVELLGYRTLFMLSAIPSAMGVLLIIFRIKERKFEQLKIFKGISFKNIDKNFSLLLLLSTLFALGSFSYSFLLIYAKHLGFQITFVPLLYLIFTASATLFSLPFGKLSDQIGRKKVLLLAFFLWGLVCFNFVLFQGYYSIILGFIFYGAHKAALDTVQKTFVSELAPPEYKASTLGGFQMVIGLCALPASFIAGILWDKVSLFMPFYFSLALTIISSLLLLAVREK